ncbi:hypothetical protein D3C85_1213640 [compost metagenome]
MAVHGGVGGAGIALLQGVQEIVAALAPQRVLAFLVRRRGGQGGQQGEGFRLATGRAQQTDPFQHHGRVVGDGGAQAGDDGVGRIGGAQGHDGVGDGLTVGGDHIDHSAGRRAVRAEQQHVETGDVIVRVQPSAPAVGDRGLLRFFEGAGAPPVADQGLGFAALTLLLQGPG